MRETLHAYWFMALDRRWRHGHVLLGILLFVLIGGLLSLLFGLWAGAPDGELWRFGLGVCLFFAFINAYALTSTIAVIRRMQVALEALRPELQITDEDFEHARASLAAAPTRHLIFVALASLAAGTSHTLLLFYATGRTPGFSTIGFLTSQLGTMFTWIVMVHVIDALVRNAHLFARLGRHHVRVDVLQSSPLTPFGTAAWLPATALMGTQIAYPLLSLGGFNPAATLPGFLLTFITVLYLLIRPMWDVHVHLREARQALIEAIDVQIRQWRRTHPDRLPASSPLHELSVLMQFKAQVHGLPVWPFNPGLALRWLLYVVIPPMTWIFAALAEHFVDVWFD